MMRFQSLCLLVALLLLTASQPGQDRNLTDDDDVYGNFIAQVGRSLLYKPL